MTHIRVQIWTIFATLWVMLFIAPAAFAEWAEQSCAFPHRIPVTITADAGGHNVETQISLTSANFPASYDLSAQGNDVRIFESDDLTPVDFVVSDWNPAARTAIIYIRKTLAPSSSEILYIYLGDNSLPSGNSASVVFPDVGIRLHSRVSTADPTDAATARAAFLAATTDVDNSVRTSVNGLNNRALGGTNGNYGWCISGVLNVTSATSGSWGFRYGGDFGYGGHLYVNEQAVEEDWNDDLWWANNYGNTAETLEGTITLNPGWHRYEILGFEGCCDGPVGFQARAPGGSWQNLSTTNFTTRATQCLITTVSVSVGSPESCSTVLAASKSVSMDASSPSDFAIPGAIVRYDLNVTNPGQSVDSGSLSLTDIFPSDVALITSGPGAFEFSDGAVSSGLSFTYGGPTDATDNVFFSADGTDFSYEPNTPSDINVTHIRFSPSGIFNPNNAGDQPSFSISILGEVR